LKRERRCLGLYALFLARKKNEKRENKDVNNQKDAGNKC